MGGPSLALFETWVSTRMGSVGQPGIMRVAQVSGSSSTLLPCSPSSCVLAGLENRGTRSTPSRRTVLT